MNDGKEKIKKQLEVKKKRLKKIKKPKLPEGTVRDLRKDTLALQEELKNYEKVQAFLEELETLTSFLECEKKTDESIFFDLATPTAIKRLIKKADFSLTEFDGEYCQVVLIRIYPFPVLYLVYMKPLNSVLP